MNKVYAGITKAHLDVAAVDLGGLLSIISIGVGETGNWRNAYGKINKDIVNAH